MKHYTKPFKTHAEQVLLLKSRGLDIPDPGCAENVLASLNYYRFTGYALPFLRDREHFLSGVAFDDVLSVYRYDRALRDLLFEAVEAVELDFRTRLAYAFSRQCGALGYRDSRNFSSTFPHADLLKGIDAELDRSHEPCVAHFKTQYLPGEIPFWAVVEVLSFGTLVKFYRALSVQGQQNVSVAYGIKWDILGSYLWHLSVVRNLCAHHARIYDRKFYNFRPLNEWRKMTPTISNTQSVFHQCALVYRLLRNVSKDCFDRDAWKRGVIDHFRSAPSFPCADIAAIMGIPSNVDTSPLWV